MKNSIPTIIGLVTGVVLSVESSHAWPLLWTFIAGALTVFLLARRGSIHRWGEALSAAAKTGMIAAILFFVATLGGLALLGYPQDDAAELAANGGINGTFILGLALAALVMLVATVIGGAAAYPLARRRGGD